MSFRPTVASPPTDGLRALCLALLLPLLMLLAGRVHAQVTQAARVPDETVAKLVQTGRIALGANDYGPPVSYRDPRGQHVGYQMDICLRIVQAIRQRYSLPDLKVVTVPMTGASRFASLANGSVDIACGHNPITSTAQQQALLTHATMLLDQKLMTVAEKNLLTPSALDGKTVGMIVGGTGLPALRYFARNAGLKITEVRGRTSKDLFEQLEAGRVDAILTGESYLMTQRVLSAQPERYTLMAGAVRTDALVMMFRLHDEGLLALANEVIEAMMRTGEMARLYDKWFVQPVPDLGGSMGMPMSADLKELFAHPGSEVEKL